MVSHLKAHSGPNDFKQLINDPMFEMNYAKYMYVDDTIVLWISTDHGNSRLRL